MYSMEKDTYICDTCRVEVKWDGHDEKKGTIWECEYCGKHFCTACFVEKAGREAFDRMFRETDFVLCPEHFEKGVFGVGG